MRFKTVIAIDPGKSGGIAVWNKGFARAVKMPPTIPKMQEYFQYLLDTYNDVVVFIEKVQAYRGDHDDHPGKMFGINKMLQNYAELLTVIKLSGIPFIEVYPISWQSKLGLAFRKMKLTKTQKKNEYKSFAIRAFPEVNPVTLPIADALCIIQFALTKLANDELWIDDHIQNIKKDDLFQK